MWVADCEADGLLDEITKLHCFAAKKHKKDQMVLFTYLDELPESFIKEQNKKYNIKWHDLSYLTEWLEQSCDILCIHNLFGYDLEALKLTGYIESYDIYPEHINHVPKRLIDTLSMSRCLWPDRPLPKGCPSKVFNEVTGKMDTIGSHGLAAWGYRVANMKPKIDDWRNQPLEVYCDRVIQDVIINDLTLESLIKEANKLARGDTVPKIGFKSEWKSALRINNKSDFLMCKQEKDGILFDVQAAEKLRDRIDKEMDELAKEVEAELPLRELPKSARANFPSEPFKKDGDISSSGWSWLKRLGYNVNDEAFNQVKIPAKPFKADGTLSATGLKFCESQGFEGTEEELKSQINALRRSQEAVKPLSDRELRKAARDLKNRLEPDWRVPMEISNQDDIKLYLVTELNWFPTLWNTKDITRTQDKRPVPEEEQEVKIDEYIEKYSQSPYSKFIESEMELKWSWASSKLKRQIRRKARFLITTPKLKDERGELCPSLEHLKGEMAQKIVKWLSLRNRRSVIQSKDEKKQTGWLNNPRLQVDGRIGQGFSGVTNTNRYKHRVIVNLPKADPDVLLGKEMRSLFIAPEDYYIIGYDGSNLEQFVGGSYAWIFDQGTYLQELKGDAHQRNADAYTIAAGRDVSRGEGKGVTYAVMYGAQAPKIAAMLGIDRDTGQKVIDAFWDANLGLKKFKNALEKYWENTGNKYIRGIDGRKIYTRSKHSLVNAAFQSCGATLMSVSGCYMYNLLVDAGVELGDKVIRLAYVHDEYQYQVHKSLVDVYEFDTEEECKEFSIKGKLLSNPKQKDGKWYRYYSIVGELGNRSLTKAGEYLKMPVTFTAAYDVGSNLAETH